MDHLTHIDEEGNARMVDVTDKAETQRTAVAEGRVLINGETYRLLAEGTVPKGDVLAAARIAGIQAAKHTWEWIPLCHQIRLTGVTVEVQLRPDPCQVYITAKTVCKGETGVEMEALTAVSAAALTVYDMCKAVQRDMVITGVRLLEKDGGRSGRYCAEEEK